MIKNELISNFSEIITFANLFGKTTGIPVVNIHNNTNENIFFEMRNQNTQNDFMYIICDNHKIIGFNAKLNQYRCSSNFPKEFHSQIEEATLEFTKNVMISFCQDINRFRLLHRSIYTPNEYRVAQKYLDRRSEIHLSKNEFNKWRKESIPLIEFKKDKDHSPNDIIDVEIYS